MAFNPYSTIFLCNVPIDSTYKNEIYFNNRDAQKRYFDSRVVKTFTNYLTVRATRPDGSLQSSVKVNANIDYLRSLPCNYMFYQNENHGTRIFYAFITQFIYINENTTQINFETDVFQTWFLDTEVKPSYVVREHSITDKIGENIVPEKFNFSDYVYQDAYTDNTLDEWGYLIATTDHDMHGDPTFWESIFGTSDDPVINGKVMSGIYQGMFFYYFHNSNTMNTFLNKVVERSGDCVMFITVIPKFSISANSVGVPGDDWGNTGDDGSSADAQGFIGYSLEPAEKTITLTDLTKNGSFEGYTPRNNKLFTAPFYRLVVTNHNGNIAEYNIEDFTYPDEVVFKMYGDVSANPSIALVPTYYKGIVSNYDCGISISGFPQASFNTDTYKLWLAKNQFGVAVDTVGNIGQIVAGIVGIVGTGGLGTAIGASAIASGASGVLSTINTMHQASREPNKVSGGGSKTNLLTAMKKNKFDYHIQTIKREHAMLVDDFFTMYGYQVNKVKYPQLSSRPYFNYVQTIDINIIGAIPSDDMTALKSIFNSGVTLWKPDATVGDYSVNNVARQD